MDRSDRLVHLSKAWTADAGVGGEQQGFRASPVSGMAEPKHCGAEIDKNNGDKDRMGRFLTPTTTVTGTSCTFLTSNSACTPDAAGT